MLPLNTLVQDRYRIVQPIDERLGGQVYRARDEQADRAVLLGALPLDEAHAADTEQLSRQLAGARHERLLPLSDHFAEGAAYFMVCDDPGGRDLERVIRARGGALPEQDVLTQARALLDTLEYLHSQRPPFYLGELWASDVIVTESGEWLLTPFTLARTIDQSPAPYRAPELASSNVEPGQASDMYAISALLYHALTGYPPPTPEQQQAGTPLSGPRALNPALSTLAEQALLRGLQFKQQNRYQTAREMRLALDTVQMMAGRPLGMISAVAPPPSQTAAPQGALEPEPALAPPEAFQPPPATSAYAVPPPSQWQPNQAAPAAPPKRGISTGCLIGAVVGLVVVVSLLCFALLALLLASAPVRAALGFGAPVVAATPLASVVALPTIGSVPDRPSRSTQPPLALGPRAITLQNASQITATQTITSPAVGAAAFGPDGTLAVASGSAISLRAGATLQEERRLEGHSGSVGSLAWSPDGKLLASGGINDTTVRLWNPASGQLVRSLSKHSGWIRNLAWSPDGALLASSSTDQSIVLWNVASGTATRQLDGHTDYVGGVAFSPDGALLASASRDGTVRLWDVASGQPRAGFSFTAPINPSTNKPYWTTSVAWSPDGKQIAVGAIDSVVRLLDAATGTLQRELRGHDNWVIIRGLAYTPDGKTLISEDLNGTVIAWDTATGTKSGQFEGIQLSADGISLSADGKQLVSTSADQGILLLWNVADPTQAPRTLRIGQGVITNIVYADDSSALALVGYDGVLKLRQLRENKDQLLIGSSVASQPAAFTPDNRLAVISDEGGVAVLDSTQASKQLTGLDGRPLCLTTGRDGSIAVGNDAGAVGVWDAASDTPRATLQSGLPLVARLAINDSGTLLAAGGSASDPRIALLDLATGKQQRVLDGLQRGITGLAWQPRSTLLAASDSAGTLRLWDTQTGAVTRTITATSEQERFFDVAFSPDGTLLAAGTLSGVIVLWNAQTGDVVTTITVPHSSIIALAWSPDGQQLAASVRGDNAAVLLFTLPQ